jgi:hypothetical protein
MSSSYVPPHLRAKTATAAATTLIYNHPSLGYTLKKSPSPNKTFNKQTSYKAIVVPIIGNKYIVVRDVKTKNKTFIGGGCKKTNASKRNCALRELKQESKNTIRVNRNNLKPFGSFNSRNRSKSERMNNLRQKRNVTLRHILFKVRLPNTTSINTIKKKFNSFRSNDPEYLETNNIYLMSKNNLNRDPKLWNFMRKHVLSRLT